MAIDLEKHELPQDQQTQLSAHSPTHQEDSEAKSEDRLKPEKMFPRYFQANVSTRNVDVLMLTCCLISGLTDSAIYNGLLPCSFLPDVP